MSERNNPGIIERKFCFHQIPIVFGTIKDFDPGGDETEETEVSGRNLHQAF